MGAFDYLVIVLTLVLFKPVNSAILGYPLTFLKLWRESSICESSPQLEFQWDFTTLKRWLTPFGIVLLSLFSPQFLSWSAIDPGGYLRLFFLVAAFVVSWKAITLDVDLATNKALIIERILLFLSLIGIYFYPPFALMVLFIAINCFRAWTHHQHLTLRLLQIFCAYLAAFLLLNMIFSLLSITSARVTSSSLIVLSMFVIVSHYFAAGIGKAKLGVHWYSWIKDNKIHYLVSSAYLWGWMRFLPEKRVLSFLGFLKYFDRPIQAGIFVIECGSILALFDVRLCLFILAAFVLLHLFIFLLAGILFWESMFVECVFFAAIFALPELYVQTVFNVTNGSLFALGQILFNISSVLWRPTVLAWWDTPLVCRIHWIVIGVSGKIYGLYNNFMSPQERLFDKIYTYSLTKEKMITGHLGEVSKLKLRDAIVASQGNPLILEQLTSFHGRSRHDQKLEDYHDTNLIRFFQSFNAKKRKQVCPAWLKAPGELLYYWGRLEPFRGQEPVAYIQIIFREEFYDGEHFRLIKEKLLKQLTITERWNKFTTESTESYREKKGE